MGRASDMGHNPTVAAVSSEMIIGVLGIDVAGGEAAGAFVVAAHGVLSGVAPPKWMDRSVDSHFDGMLTAIVPEGNGLSRYFLSIEEERIHAD